MIRRVTGAENLVTTDAVLKNYRLTLPNFAETPKTAILCKRYDATHACRATGFAGGGDENNCPD
jgi:hypothetical protein